jgi:hypothetical protein
MPDLKHDRAENDEKAVLEHFPTVMNCEGLN